MFKRASELAVGDSVRRPTPDGRSLVHAVSDVQEVQLTHPDTGQHVPAMMVWFVETSRYATLRPSTMVEVV